MKLSLKFEMGRVEVELADTPTARALIEALPFESKTHIWGEEVYFATPVQAALEGDAKQVPYGHTRISTDERSQLASRCNIVGTVVGDPRRLAAVKPGQAVIVDKA